METCMCTFNPEDAEREIKAPEIVKGEAAVAAAGVACCDTEAEMELAERVRDYK
jgi:hypothetical protein